MSGLCISEGCFFPCSFGLFPLTEPVGKENLLECLCYCQIVTGGEIKIFALD